MVSTLVSILLVFFIQPNALALFLHRLFAQSKSLDSRFTLLLAYGAAPMLSALLLYLAYLVAPGQSQWLYRGIVLVPFALMAAAGWRHRRKLGAGYRDLLRATVGAWRRRSGLLVGLVASIMVLICLFVALAFPISGYDALSHAYRGRAIAEQSSLQPVTLLEPDENGYVRSSVYPPGLHCLYAWLYVVGGSTETDHAARFVSPWYFGLLVLLCAYWASRIRPGAGVYAAFLTAGTPLLFSQAAASSIDALRVYLLVAGLLAIRKQAEEPTWPMAFVSGGLLGASCFVHSLSVTALPISGILYLAYARDQHFARRLWMGGVTIALATGIAGIEFLRRLISFGSLSAPLLYTPEPEAETLARRGLDTIGGVFWNGVLAPLLDVRLFGFGLWLGIAGTITALLRRLPREILYVALSLFGLMILIYMAPFPGLPGYANPRYILTVMPLACVAGGPWLLWLQRKALALLSALPKEKLQTYAAIVAIVGGIAVSAAALILTPSFVEAHLSLDQHVELSTMRQIQSFRVVLIGIGAGIAGAGVILGLPLRRRKLALSIGLLVGLVILAGAVVMSQFTKGLGEVTKLLAVVRVVFGAIGLAIAAFFSMAIVSRMSLERFSQWRSGVLEHLPTVALVVVLALPFVTVSPKSANLGNLYRLSDITRSDEDKLGRSGLTASVFYLNEHAPKGSLVLVTEDTYFFYYSVHPGIYWRDVRLSTFHSAPTPEEGAKILRELGVTHIQLSDRTQMYELYQNSVLRRMMDSDEFVEELWHPDISLSTGVYRLQP